MIIIDYIFCGFHILLICAFFTPSDFAEIMRFCLEKVALKSISVSILNVIVLLGTLVDKDANETSEENNFHRKEILAVVLETVS